MQVKDWGGGLTFHEITAIEKMKQAFQNSSNQKDLKGQGFKVLKNFQSIFPWQGYSGFRFADVRQRKEGEFDLVIITHCNVLVVELKHWNGGAITSNGSRWFKGNQDMDYSPVQVTRNKTFLLKKKLEKFRGKFGNSSERFPIPKIEFLVVMSGNSDFSALPDNEKIHVMSLDNFLELADDKKFTEQFGEYTKFPKNRTLNTNFTVFDQIFEANTVKPKSINRGGYYAEDTPIFSHPKQVYQEYLAQSENMRHQDQVLLRRWNFSKIEYSEAQTPEGRYRLVSREYDVLNHIKLQNQDLYRSCLNYKSTPQKGEITAEHIDLFELLPQQKRFNHFVGGYNCENLSIDRRLGLVHLLLDKFAQLHKIGIAHRDLGENSIWLSADDKVTLSGFATAHFSSEQSVGDIRTVLEISGDLAKDVFPTSKDSKFTPYQYDVRSLAILAWHIIEAQRISPSSISAMNKQLLDNPTWYADILRTALSERPFANAQQFLEEFNRIKPKNKVNFSFDFTKLDPFIHDINHSRTYREDEDFIVETSEKEVYCSNGLLVKAWLNADPQQDNAKARVVLKWLESMSKLAKLSPDYLPKIHEFGIAKKSGCLFAVSEFIEGNNWKDAPTLNLSNLQKQTLISQLIHDIEHLHSLGFTHGDLKPDNVLIIFDEGEVKLRILDILDFSLTGLSQFNTEYSPEFDYATEIQRDNFAVMKMACELLDIDCSKKSEEFSEISQAIQLEEEDSQSGFISLARFKEALNPKSKVVTMDISVGGRDEFAPIGIYPENGELFIQLKISQKHPTEEIDVTFTGLGGKLTAFYVIQEKKFRHALLPFARDYITKVDRDSSDLSIGIGLNISYTKSSNLNQLNDFLATHGQFNHIITEFIANHINKKDSVENIKDEEFVRNQIVDSSEILTLEPHPSIQQLWQAILDTETEALPSITANDELNRLEDGEIYISYDGEINPLDQFKRDEIVEAIGRSDNGEKTFKYGVVDIAKSSLNELHLKSKSLSQFSYRIQADTPIYLQSIQNKASYKRRKNALQRILDNESVVKNLVQYFDENCSLPTDYYNIKVSDKEFARYDQPEKGVSLNEPQREAFQRLVSNGPLSLLQGPPGTGKTEFIAAFVHYLFDVQKVKNILLVSQSHEAVNTAAERIRKHCTRLGTNLELVRFSNREVADSEILEDVFSPNLVGQKRQQLNVNKINNICQLGRSMQLPENYLRERAELSLDIGVKINRYLKIIKPSSTTEKIDEDEKYLHKKLELSIRSQSKELGITDNILDIEEIMPKLIDSLDKRYAIQPAESLQAKNLIDLTQDMLEALSNDRANYDEFLARSRQLVIGTCVGIGQRHIGIADNVYDWVIVDEAARSISSELAIAMQSGSRILLVGDHKQLPPLYSEEHKNALARRLGISKRGEELDQALGSDFERVFLSSYGKNACAILKTQYRMAPAIGSLVSACFYENVLENGKTDDNVPDIYFNVPEKIKSYVTWLDTSSLPNTHHESAKSGSLSNRAEADVIISLLQDLANDEVFMDSDIVQKSLDSNTQTIGVICMYGEQKKLIRKKFNERTWNEDFRRLVKIDSVDSYQGKENRIIILSLTRHDKQYTTGFLHLPNRINVALSRAMDKLIIVGAKNVWEQPKNSKTPLAKVLRFIQQNEQENPRYYAVKTLKNTGAKK